MNQTLFKGTDLAGFCGCDLKTIHNWADKGKIEHFRTPGRHLRFKPEDVKTFLEKYGYPIPDEVTKALESTVGTSAAIETTGDPHSKPEAT